jgi:hypothetical protein
MTATSTQAHFTVTGEAITKIARDLMVSDEPGKAYRLLADCLIGAGAEDVSRRVLTGEINLIGDSVNGIDVETADPEGVREYVELMRYAGRVKIKGKWYRPRGVVLSYGADDARAAIRGARATDDPISTMNSLGRRRAEYYAGRGERVELVTHCGDIEVHRNGAYVVFEPCSDSPVWMKPAHDAQAAVTEALAAGRSLERIGAFDNASAEVRVLLNAAADTDDEDEAEEIRDLAYAIEDEQRAALLAEIGAKVREQAGEDVFPLELLDGRVVQVPRAPFMHWALSRLPEFPRDRLPAWAPVSHSGIKMQMDDPHHTDWVLGAGLTVDEGYSENVTSPAWGVAADMQIAEVDRRG